MDMSTPLALYNHILRGEIIWKIILTTTLFEKKINYFTVFKFYISKLDLYKHLLHFVFIDSNNNLVYLGNFNFKSALNLSSK